MSLILKQLLTNKYVWIAIAFILLVGYYKVQIFNLESTINEKQAKINKVTKDNNTLTTNIEIARSNTKKAVEVNKNNLETIDQLQKNITSINTLNSQLINKKDKTILSLKKIIADLNKKVVYPKEMSFVECKFKIKTKEDRNESDFTANSLNSIGF